MPALLIAAATAFALMLAWYLHGKLAPGLPQLLLAFWVVVKLLVAGARALWAWAPPSGPGRALSQALEPPAPC